MKKSKIADKFLNIPRIYRGKQYPKSKGMAIVREAKEHLVFNASEMPVGIHWSVLNKKAHESIDGLVTAQDVIFYAQSKAGFDHRTLSSSWRPLLGSYTSMMISEFRHLSSLISTLGDSPYSRPETLLKYEGRLVSNVYFWHMMYILQCITHVKERRIVCEIGGGYGAPARLWLQNPAFRPGCYVDIDFPESLFFAEVFLRVNFNDLKILYVSSPDRLSPDVVSKYSVILCPVNFVNAISSLSLDLVINTGSLQEMTDEWVDFWMQWLTKQDCRWFYSMNYFAQPLYSQPESRSTWSPRLTPEWTVRLQRFNPVSVKALGVYNRNIAEILAQKQPAVPRVGHQTAEAQYQLMKNRILDGQVLLESLDIIRLHPEESMIWDLLLRSVTEMPRIPKESWYLADYLEKQATPAFQERNGEQLHNLRRQLNLMRLGGKEDLETYIRLSEAPKHHF